MGPRSGIAVVHLVREQNGGGPVARFITSYRAEPAGIEHELVVAFKGFRDCRPGVAYREILGGVEYRPIFLPDAGLDIGSYFAAARVLKASFLCFLNSYSTVIAPGWLEKLFLHACRASVGLVGASGSYESVASRVAASAPSPAGRWYLAPRRFLGRCRFRLTRGLAERQYALFPNPHIRTNGFLIRRELMLDLAVPRIRSKADALRFESGRDGLTRQVLGRGLDALVVGADGRAYGVGDWYESRTFRSGDQENLLIADNRTEQYANADPTTRRVLAEYAWGLREAPSAVPVREGDA